MNTLRPAAKSGRRCTIRYDRLRNPLQNLQHNHYATRF